MYLYFYIFYIPTNFFWKCLDIMSILHKSPNATEINMIWFPSKILNFWRFNMNSHELESQQRVAVNGYPFEREDKKMKCALKAMVYSNFYICLWKNCASTSYHFHSFQFFWEFLNIIYILYKLPNSSEISLIRFLPKILNLWRFYINS